MCKTTRPAIVLSTLVLVFSLSGSSFAGSPGDPRWNLLTAEGVVQITVDVVVDKGPFTNANPPKLQVTVGEIVRGKFANRQIEVIWTPPPHDIDTGGEDDPRLIAWRMSAFAPPKIGTQWIATYYGAESSPYANKVPCLGYRFPYSPEKLAWTKQYIQQETAARKQRELERQMEIDRIRKTDLEVEKRADLRRMYEAASDIVIAKRVSGGLPYLSFMIERRVKDGSKTPNEKQKFLEVAASKNDEAMIAARLTAKYVTELDRMLLFLRVIPSTRDNPPNYLENVDQRLFEFVDSGNGVLIATDARLNELKSLENKK